MTRPIGVESWLSGTFNYHGRRDVRVADAPEPREPAADEVTVEVTMGSLCGTDLGEFVHGPKLIPLTRRSPASGHLDPTIIGHEFAGRVVPRGRDVGSLAVGARIVPGAGSWCDECRWCREGRVKLCREYFVYGLHADGGFADYVNVPAKMCCAVPAACSERAAPIAQPLAVAIHALRRARACPGDSVAVVGAGGIGALIIAAAAAAGIDSVIAVDMWSPRPGRDGRGAAPEGRWSSASAVDIVSPPVAHGSTRTRLQLG